MSRSRRCRNAIASLAAGMLVWVAAFSCAHQDPAVRAPVETQSNSELHLKPYRVLVVAGDQMRDDYVIHDAWDFGDIVGLLKLWGVPFDVLRLDSHTLRIGDFLDEAGNARYGTIIWTARSQKDYPWRVQDCGLVAKAVREHRISFIGIGNKIQDAPIQELLGLRYPSFGPIHDPMVVNETAHFVTRGWNGAKASAAEAFIEGGPKVLVVAPDVTTLASAGRWPQLTVRTLDAPSRTRAVWIGGDPDTVFQSSPIFMKLFQRSLVWAEGYALYKDYGKSVILRMDDPGCAQSSYLKGWNYPQLDQAAIRDWMLPPLRAHHATLGVAFVPGFPWIPDHSIRRSSSVDFTDPFGVRQNIRSACAGLLEGVKSGDLEIESHGLTHMAPDLDSAPPGGSSWWNGTVKGEWFHDSWYREFYDERRGREVDARTQRARLVQSADWIEQDFGRRPLVFVPPGNEVSGDPFTRTDMDLSSGNATNDQPVTRIADTYTFKIAGEVGYGLGLGVRAHYLGKDHVITLEMCPQAHHVVDLKADFARGVPALLRFHDRDIALSHNYLFDLLGRVDSDARYMAMDEWVGYLHAVLDVTAPTRDCLCISFMNGDHYGRYFADHPSSWTLHLTDEVAGDLKGLGRINVIVDGAVAHSDAAEDCFSERQTITCPAGVGIHTVRFSR